jgi:hypothetical protein
MTGRLIILRFSPFRRSWKSIEKIHDMPLGMRSTLSSRAPPNEDEMSPFVMM